MTRQQWRNAHAAFLAGGWVAERCSRGPRYALPGTPWRGRVGDLYVMLYRVEGREAWDVRFLAPREMACLPAVLARVQTTTEAKTRRRVQRQEDTA